MVLVRVAFCRPFQLGPFRRQWSSKRPSIPNHDEVGATGRILVPADRDHEERDAEEGRWLVIAGSGVVIGPAAMALWILILAALGEPYAIRGDPAFPLGLVACVVFAFIVGSVTTILYVSALKLIHRLTRASNSRAHNTTDVPTP